eukprot:COSAG01_NODE_2022_length_8630_cov_16.836010_8_plen_92_part_00
MALAEPVSQHSEQHLAASLCGACVSGARGASPRRYGGARARGARSGLTNTLGGDPRGVLEHVRRIGVCWNMCDAWWVFETICALSNIRTVS